MSLTTLPGWPGDWLEWILELLSSLTQADRQKLIDALNDPEIEEQAMINEYKKLWAHLREVEWWDFICIEDKSYSYFGSDEVYVSRRTDKEEFERRKESVWCYWYNNGTITYVDGEWRQFIGRYTRENVEALKVAWYTDRWMDIWVPFSNGEQFIDRDLQEEWEYLYRKSVVDRRKEEQKMILDEYRKLWSHLRKVEWWDFICVDGKWYTRHWWKVEYIGKNTDVEMFERRKNAVWCYWSNNSTITYVDEEWRQFVWRYTRENVGALEAAWYTDKWMSIRVPFSNGEKFADKKLETKRESFWEEGSWKGSGLTVRVLWE